MSRARAGVSLLKTHPNQITVTPSGCWVWNGARTVGYGRVKRDGRLALTHRHEWEAANGPVPDGLQLDHLCRNRACCNPAHIEPVTQRENILRGVGPAAINARKTHCDKGHPLSGENLYTRPSGGRYCRTCKRDSNRRRDGRYRERQRVYMRGYRARELEREQAVGHAHPEGLLFPISSDVERIQRQQSRQGGAR